MRLYQKIYFLFFPHEGHKAVIIIIEFFFVFLVALREISFKITPVRYYKSPNCGRRIISSTQACGESCAAA